MSYGALLGTEIGNWHRVLFSLCCGITIVVFIILMYSLIKRRYSKNTTEGHFHKSFFLEIVWTVVPFLILIALAFPAAKVLFASSKITYRGVLLQPPLNMQDFNMFTTTEKKWQIVYIPAECCDNACGKELFQLAQLKKALGEKGNQVILKLVAKQACEVHDLRHVSMEAINMQQVKRLQETLTQQGEAMFDITNKIYVIDPNQNLYLYYLSSDSSADLLSDLRRILEVSAIG